MVRLGVVLSLLMAASVATADTRPNVIVMVADDRVGPMLAFMATPRLTRRPLIELHARVCNSIVFTLPDLLTDSSGADDRARPDSTGRMYHHHALAKQWGAPRDFLARAVSCLGLSDSDGR